MSEASTERRRFARWFREVISERSFKQWFRQIVRERRVASNKSLVLRGRRSERGRERQRSFRDGSRETATSRETKSEIVASRKEGYLERGCSRETSNGDCFETGDFGSREKVCVYVCACVCGVGMCVGPEKKRRVDDRTEDRA